MSVPFAKKVASFIPLDSGNFPPIPQNKYPVKIEPNHSKIFFIINLKQLKESISSVNLIKRFFIRFYIITDDGRKFKAHISKPLRKEIISIKNQPIQK